MVNLKTLLRRAVFAGVPDGDRPEAENPPEKLLRGGLERWPSPRPVEKWRPPTKGTAPADRKRILRRQARRRDRRPLRNVVGTSDEPRTG